MAYLTIYAYGRDCEGEWHAIQREQKSGVTPQLRQRRIAMGMTEFPRS